MPFSAESALISWIQSETGVPCYGDVPKDRPGKFVTVERTGGSEGPGIGRPSLAVQVWGPSKYEASALAAEVAELLWSRAPEIPQIRSCTVNSGPYSFPDPDSYQPRYQIYIDLVTV